MQPLKWKPARGQYASGEEAWIGKVCVGLAFYALGSKGEPVKYRAAIHLPTIQLKTGTTDWATLDHAKARVERAVAVWFEWLDKETGQ